METLLIVDFPEVLAITTVGGDGLLFGGDGLLFGGDGLLFGGDGLLFGGDGLLVRFLISTKLVVSF